VPSVQSPASTRFTLHFLGFPMVSAHGMFPSRFGGAIVFLIPFAFPCLSPFVYLSTLVEISITVRLVLIIAVSPSCWLPPPPHCYALSLFPPPTMVLTSICSLPPYYAAHSSDYFWLFLNVGSHFLKPLPAFGYVTNPLVQAYFPSRRPVLEMNVTLIPFCRHFLKHHVT